MNTRKKIRADWTTDPKAVGYAESSQEAKRVIKECQDHVNIGNGDLIGVRQALSYAGTIRRDYCLSGACVAFFFAWADGSGKVDISDLSMDLLFHDRKTGGA